MKALSGVINADFERLGNSTCYQNYLIDE
jgi:hypothetical protein